MLNNGIACKPAILAKHVSIRHMLKFHIKFMIDSFVLSVCLSLLLFVGVFAFMCMLQEAARRLCLGPWGRWAMARSAGCRRKGTLGFNTERTTCVCTHSNTHSNKDATTPHTHICTHNLPANTSQLPSVNRCFLSSSPNHTASRAVCPYRVTQGPGEGADPPVGSSVVFLLLLDPVPICWPTHLSPDRADCNFSATQDRKLTFVFHPTKP